MMSETAALVDIGLTLDDICRTYGLGVVIAAGCFIRANSDWGLRLKDGVVYSLAWPYNFVKWAFEQK